MSEQVISAEFRSLIADLQAAVDKTEGFSDYRPAGSPNGLQYPVLFKGIKTGTKTDENTGQKTSWVRAEFEVVDGEDKGKNFGIPFTSKQAWRFNEFCSLVSLMTQDPAHSQSRQLLPALEAAVGCAGKHVIQMTAKTRQNGPNTYTNYYFDKVLDSVVA